jgi:PIN domain nuclease of toxin-antitoxin system
MIYLDTHVTAWLYAGRTDLLSEHAKHLINDKRVLVSPMLVLELQYLFETNRTSENAQTVIENLSLEIGLTVCDLPFPAVIRHALGENWTRDPFDRVITSQAALRKTQLLTRDRSIQKHYPQAVWE